MKQYCEDNVIWKNNRDGRRNCQAYDSLPSSFQVKHLRKKTKQNKLQWKEKTLTLSQGVSKDQLAN